MLWKLYFNFNFNFNNNLVNVLDTSSSSFVVHGDLERLPWEGIVLTVSPTSNSCCWRGDSQRYTKLILIIDIGNRLRESRSSVTTPTKGNCAGMAQRQGLLCGGMPERWEKWQLPAGWTATNSDPTSVGLRVSAEEPAIQEPSDPVWLA